MTAHHDHEQYRETLSDIQDVVATYSQQGTIIIAGDFNTSKTRATWLAILGHLQNRHYFQNVCSVTTWSQHRYVFHTPNGYTFIPTKSTIDHILLEETSICNIEKFSILPESDILTSDHLPLFMSNTVDCVLKQSSPFKQSIAWVKCSDTVLESYHNEVLQKLSASISQSNQQDPNEINNALIQTYILQP